METTHGLLTKLGLFGVCAVGMFVVGKKHIAQFNDERHREETDARTDSDDNEFRQVSRRRGFPENNPRLDYQSDSRELRYVGLSTAYATRSKGDRLSTWNILLTKWGSDEDK